MKRAIYSLLLTGAMIIPVPASAQLLKIPAQPPGASANVQHASSQSQVQMPVETRTYIMMSVNNLDSYTISQIQKSLTDRGFYQGAVTGTWDNNTATALRNFQQGSDDKIDESGKLISDATLSRLGVPLSKLTAGDGAKLSDNNRSVSTPSLQKSAATGGSFSPYNSPTMKSLGSVQMAANDETVGSHVSNSKMAAPGQTVPAPDNGTKSTVTRDAVKAGTFDKTIEGKKPIGVKTGDAGAIQGTPAPSNSTSGVAATGSSTLRAGSTSSSAISGTGSLTGNATGNASTNGDASTASNIGTLSGNVSRSGVPNTTGTDASSRSNASTSASVGTTGTLSNNTGNTSVSGTSLSGGGTATNNADGRLGPGSPASTASPLGGGAANSLSGGSSGSGSGSLGGGSSASGGSAGGGGGGGL